MSRVMAAILSLRVPEERTVLSHCTSLPLFFSLTKIILIIKQKRNHISPLILTLSLSLSPPSPLSLSPYLHLHFLYSLISQVIT